MTGYTPKVGDKVRAVLGQTVIVGTVSDAKMEDQPPFINITPADLSDDSDIWLWVEDGWVLENVTPVPSKFGAVIRRADGARFLTYGDGGWYNDDGDYHETSEATAGGFTIEFDGVDE